MRKRVERIRCRRTGRQKVEGRRKERQRTERNIELGKKIKEEEEAFDTSEFERYDLY